MRIDPVSSQKLILVASAEVGYGGAVERFIASQGYTVEQCHDAKGVYRLVGRHRFDVVLLDLLLNAGADVDLVTFVRRQSPDAQLILLFDPSDVAPAIEGIRRGAFFYLPKSCQPSDVALIVDKAVDAARTLGQAQAYEQARFEQIIGASPAMRRVAQLITKVAPTDGTVLLLGESGTGKEVMANAIHRLSARRDRAFIAINCAALPEHLLESELFGHVKGAFTGAESDKRGLFEEADGGTIFLDEIGDMAPMLQAKLLRVLQNGEFRRVGDSAVRRCDVRVLAATNMDLAEAIREKRFREDLYFRLNVIQIRIPPLRDRLDSLPAFVDQFLRRFNAQYHGNVRNIDEHAWRLLQRYSYPGNVRELESIIAHAVILAEGDTIRASDLPDHVLEGAAQLALPHYSDREFPSLNEMEKRLIETALAKLDNNQTEVAKKLGISRSTLWRKIKEYGIDASDAGDVSPS